MSELRLDPLSGEWITIAARRIARPVTTGPLPDGGAPPCPFCPVPADAPPERREASEAPHDGYGVAVFQNRFPSLGGADADLLTEGPFAPGYRRAPARGNAEIVLYSPLHDVHLGSIPEAGVRLLVEVWRDRTEALYADPAVAYVFPFENRGRDIGATIDHPHGQIYAYPFVPPRIAREWERLAAHRAAQGECLQCEVDRRERAEGRRLVDAEGGFTAFVPFAPRFPSEVHLVPARHAGSLADLHPGEIADLARLLQRTVRRYDGLYRVPMQYMMCLYQTPRRLSPEGIWHLRLAFYPLYRAARRMKYLAGSESGAGAFLQDATPEAMAAALRGVAL